MCVLVALLIFIYFFPTGVCFIIDVQSFSWDHLRYRAGSEVDRGKLQQIKTMAVQLDFLNQKLSQIEQVHFYTWHFLIHWIA